MKADIQKIKDLLLKESYVSQENMDKAEAFSQKHKGSFLDYLLSEKIISPSLLGQALAESFHVPYADLTANPPTKNQVLHIPEKQARKYNVVLFHEEEKKVVIATDNPQQKDLIKSLAPLFSKKKINLSYALPEHIEGAFVHYRQSLDTRFSSILKKQTKVASELIHEIFEEAITEQVSDIHIEPQSDNALIRFRVDGVMQETVEIEKEYYENILNRIKVQAQLRIDQHFVPQDGAIRYTSQKGFIVDMRVAIVPTLEGEKIVIRLMSQYIRSFDLGDLGLAASDQKIIQESVKKPFGMILVTGPTGAGKTTTLYALLKILHKPEVNITTIEDPVEYRLPKVNQIQVNPDTDLTFEKGLRSIVRQDPDIILVGEIRDTITAEISVNAALTGHLLLSTFHANDAATALPRLLDMGVEPFLLASTLEVIVAQRLVRKICSHCRHSITVHKKDIAKTAPEAASFFKSQKVTLYQGKGCESCKQTGYKDRQAIFEFIHITPEMQELILESPSIQQIWKLAKKQGSKTLFENGMEKVKQGITTLEELMRVAAPRELS